MSISLCKMGDLLKEMSIHVEYGELKADFKGPYETVSREVVTFIRGINPAGFDALTKIVLQTKSIELIEKVKDIMKIDPDVGPVILASRDKISDSDIIALVLIGMKIGFDLGILSKEYLFLDEISNLTGISYNVVRARISDLRKGNFIVRGKRKDKRVPYRITRLGSKIIVDSIISKLSTT